MDYIGLSRIAAKIISFEKCLDVRNALFEYGYGGVSATMMYSDVDLRVICVENAIESVRFNYFLQRGEVEDEQQRAQY